MALFLSGGAFAEGIEGGELGGRLSGGAGVGYIIRRNDGSGGGGCAGGGGGGDGEVARLAEELRNGRRHGGVGIGPPWGRDMG